MYSSHLGGIVTDPAWMLAPVDDHLLHRGDGVFETLLCLDGLVYNLQAHLERLELSANRIGLKLPPDLTEHLTETLQAGGEPTCLARIIVSRGPGGFGVSPKECPEPGCYIITYRHAGGFMERHPEGARAIASAMPVKPGFFANIKTCNYLPNVLMKQEAEAAGVDFALSFDESGHLAEGPTENIALLGKDGMLLTPPGDRILQGTTLKRVLELAHPLVKEGLIAGIETRPVPLDLLEQAREILIIGTTTYVTALVEWEGHPVGTGAPGPVQQKLAELLKKDMGRQTP